MRGHEGAVETWHCTVLEMIQKGEHLDWCTWTTVGVLLCFFKKQDWKPMYLLYCNTFGNYAFSLKGRITCGLGNYFQEKFTVFCEEIICKCHCNSPREQLVTDATTPPHVFDFWPLPPLIKVLSWAVNLFFCGVSCTAPRWWCLSHLAATSVYLNSGSLLEDVIWELLHGTNNMCPASWCWRTWKGIKKKNKRTKSN